MISLLHNSYYEHMRWEISNNFQSVSEDYGIGVIHTDGNAVFAAVLYLSPDAPLDSGTSLFRRNKEFDQSVYEKALKVK
jgi:hypothetical protein